MADRTSENPKKNWRDFLRRSTHIDGTSVDNVNPFEASQRQIESLADINNPANNTRQTKHGVQTDQPIRGGRQDRLKPIEGTEGLL